MSDSLSFDGTNLSTYGVSLVDSPIPIFAPPKIQTANIPQSHGVAVRGQYLQPRTISVDVVIEGSSFSDLLSKLDSIRALLSPSKGDKQIIFDHQNTRYYLGRLENDIEVPVLGAKAIVATLRFFCADPLGYKTTETELVYTDGGAWDGSITYTGSIATPIVIVGDRDTADAVLALSVENETTSESIQANYALGEGNQIKFDGDRELIEVSEDGTTWTQVMKFIDSTNRTFPMLQGGSNQLTFSGFTDTGGSEYSWTVTYRERYL